MPNPFSPSLSLFKDTSAISLPRISQQPSKHVFDATQDMQRMQIITRSRDGLEEIIDRSQMARVQHSASFFILCRERKKGEITSNCIGHWTFTHVPRRTRSISLSPIALFYQSDKIICVSIRSRTHQPLSNIHSKYPIVARHSCPPLPLMLAQSQTQVATKCTLLCMRWQSHIS